MSESTDPFLTAGVPSTVPLAREPDDGWIAAEPWAMGPATTRALEGVIRALIPPAPAPAPPDMVGRIALHVRRTLPYMTPPNAWGFCLLLHLADWAPVWRGAALARLHTLPREQADAVLAGLSSSRFLALRQLMLALKGLILSTYFDQDEVHRALGFAPVPFMMERIAFRQRLQAGGEATPADLLGPHSSEIEP